MTIDHIVNHWKKTQNLFRIGAIGVLAASITYGAFRVTEHVHEQNTRPREADVVFRRPDFDCTYAKILLANGQERMIHPYDSRNERSFSDDSWPADILYGAEVSATGDTLTVWVHDFHSRISHVNREYILVRYRSEGKGGQYRERREE